MKTAYDQIEKILNFLADQLQVQRLSAEVLRGYVASLEKFPPHVLVKICQKIRDTYRPFNNSFPAPSVFHLALESEAIASAPEKTWACRCCGVPFPAGMLIIADNNGELKSGLRCACDLEYCFRCERCGKHCTCPEGLLEEQNSQEIAELRELLSSLPSSSQIKRLGKQISK